MRPLLAARPTRIVLALAAVLLSAGGAQARDRSADPAALLRSVDAAFVPSGILFDRALPLATPVGLDGSGARATSREEWRQLYAQLDRAARAAAPERRAWPALEQAWRQAGASAAPDAIPIAIMDFRYERLDPQATEAPQIEHERLRVPAAALVSGRLVAAAPLAPATYRGAATAFSFSADGFFSNHRPAPRELEIDAGDGRGFRPLGAGGLALVHYSEPGPKRVRVRYADRAHRAEGADATARGSTLEAAFTFEVRALRTPAPDDTLTIEAGIPYQGTPGTGQAYVYLADGHTAIVEPVVLIEGFDLDNSMDWDELYELLNREALLEELRARGFDLVVLDFTDATDFIQRNAFVAVELIEQVQAVLAPGRTLALAGASMGGLVGRYALAYMEASGRPHAVRTFISFDGALAGADIPLGLQYWLWFFADQSVEAAELLAALDSPAARQLLLYHYTDPPGATGESDPLRAELAADLAAIGDYPSAPRKAAAANGSGMQIDQGFAAGAQLIRWEYESFLVDITGNVWAVPDGGSQEIFYGLIDILLLPEDEVSVVVSGTAALDNAPGGWRGSMAELDTTEAPYGDIEALHPNHCFIPTVSALALETDDYFYDIAGDPDLLGLTPFDAVYFPAANEEHVAITPANAAWLIGEIESGIAGVPDGPDEATGANAPAPVAAIEAAFAPAADETQALRFSVPWAGRARLALFDATGRRIADVYDAPVSAGAHALSWDGRDRAGRKLPSGTYFLQLRGPGYAATTKLVRP